MEFMDVVATRKSVRGYLDKPVEEEKLTKLLEIARLAPSWANKQCCKYIVVKDKTKIQELSGTLNSWLKQAPVALVACADPKDSGSRNGMDYYMVDVGISMQQLVLAATDMGLGTCWIGAFDEAKVKKTLSIPENVKVVAMTPIGYPTGKEGIKTKLVKAYIGSAKRKPLEDMVHWEKW
ncbi:MAG TPA: nitroreductase family protein [Candidatus Bathyarchaeia archaeon]|nr:nitroreductase family protein [Candidatus Bathyarchaeia archaeon]